MKAAPMETKYKLPWNYRQSLQSNLSASWPHGSLMEVAQPPKMANFVFNNDDGANKYVQHAILYTE